MVILVFFAVHWYLSMYTQSFFHHRYSAHRVVEMSPATEKFWFFACWLTQGSSYLSAYAYGIMHRLHHAHTDTEKDPHSPRNSSNVMTMMWDTRQYYQDVIHDRIEIDEKYKRDLPDWRIFDRFAHHPLSRVGWGAFYTCFWLYFATEWWQWLLLPVTIAVGAVHGASVNWWAHRFGYVSHKMKNTSKNIMPVDFLFLGEAYHNNHHKYPGRPNHAMKWFEFDPIYFSLKIFHKIGWMKLRNYQPTGDRIW